MTTLHGTALHAHTNLHWNNRKSNDLRMRMLNARLETDYRK